MAQHRSMHVDVTDEQVKKLKLGQDVTITTEGKITQLRASESMEAPVAVGGKKAEEEKFPPVIQIDVSSTKVVPGGNAFAKLAEDEDDED